MERAVFPAPGDAWPDTGPWTRVYVGSESCPWLMPTLPELSRTLEEADRRGWRVTLVTPFLFEDALDRAATLLEGVGRSDLELVVNDFGLASMARERDWGFPLSLGRLLVKGPAATGVSGAASARYLAATNLESPGFGALLSDLGFSRAEIDSPPSPHGPPPSSGIALSLHHPYRLVTVASRCPWRFTGVRWHTGPCPRMCLEGGILLERVEDGVNVVLRGCAQSVAYSLPRESDLPGVDRLVYHPEPLEKP